MKNPKYNVLTFLKLESAKRKQKEMKKMFGYAPSIFKVGHPESKGTKYVIVKPRGLKRLV